MNKNISDSDLIKLFNQNTLFRLFHLTVLKVDTKEVSTFNTVK